MDRRLHDRIVIRDGKLRHGRIPFSAGAKTNCQLQRFAQFAAGRKHLAIGHQLIPRLIRCTSPGM
jgi:hypothetical protein